MKPLSRLIPRLLAAGCALVCVSAFATPANAYGPRTRAQVRSELIEWRNAGYDPLDRVNYPENAQRAGAIVAQHHAARAAGEAPAAVQQ